MKPTHGLHSYFASIPKQVSLPAGMAPLGHMARPALTFFFAIATTSRTGILGVVGILGVGATR